MFLYSVHYKKTSAFGFRRETYNKENKMKYFVSEHSAVFDGGSSFLNQNNYYALWQVTVIFKF